ncbi:uncharacterized protein SCODWIG_00133 [Saccharomycodes ludwigii]|uniref:Endoplasmic reticulum lectin n=1 Tax=Saccharomycodes ludwigii TaxID=36035 RepID=A0A376B154_9ASCO|nr:uncharacterized protein SCODWIG_00133 [Saccharomycodes ludwigii]
MFTGVNNMLFKSIVTLFLFINVISAFVANPIIQDPISLPKYDFKYITNKNNHVDNLSELLQDIGPYHNCFVETLESAEDVEAYDPNSNDFKQLLDQTIVNATIILDKLFNATSIITPSKHRYQLGLSTGYWNYIFAYNNTIVQYSNEDLSYVLGSYKETVSNPTILSNENGFYLSQHYFTGTICDITSKPRVVDVQYICDPSLKKGTAQFVTIREWRICEYEAIIATHDLCNVPLLSKDAEETFSYRVTCENPNIKSATSYLTSPNHDVHFLGESIYLLKTTEQSKNDTELDVIVLASSSASQIDDIFSTLQANVFGSIFAKGYLGSGIYTKSYFIWNAPVINLFGDILGYLKVETTGQHSDGSLSISLNNETPTFENGNFEIIRLLEEEEEEDFVAPLGEDTSHGPVNPGEKNLLEDDIIVRIGTDYDAIIIETPDDIIAFPIEAKIEPNDNTLINNVENVILDGQNKDNVLKIETKKDTKKELLTRGNINANEHASPGKTELEHDEL